MVIVLNTTACGGKALHKWNQVKDHFSDSEITILFTNENVFATRLHESIKNGETQFVAAGGDGTINHLLNSLIRIATPDQLKNITIGAIGIGSSNDFHKPFYSKIEEIPVCVDFQNAYYRDVGFITCDSDKGKVEKYFLINASVGITAEANNLFNTPNSILRNLKRISTKSVILYSAIKTLMNYKNLFAKIYIDGNCFDTSITNLGITKNSHFSGDFCYDSPVDYTSGKFDVHLAHDMNRFEVLNLMKALTSNCFSKLDKTKSWKAETLIIKSDEDFLVDYDGEILITNQVEFRVLNNFIKVCGNGKSI